MLRLGMNHRHCTAAAFLVLLAASAAVAQPMPSPGTGASTLSIFVQGMPIGSEEVTVTRHADGWTIRATGRLGAPVNITTSRFEVAYDPDWKPRRLDIEGSLRGQPLVIRTAFAGGSAVNEIMQGGQQIQKTDAVAADTLALPNMFFASYEALALRLAGTKPGSTLRAYIVPQTEIDVAVTDASEERIQTPDRVIVAKRFRLTFENPNGPVPAEMWIDENHRLLRFRVEAQGLEVAREDVASVSARVVKMPRAGDEEVLVPGNGFSLAGTLSRPPGSLPPAPKARNVPRLPAVILVPGSGPVDRDETVAGISVFAQLANALSDRGFLVLRYDKRGIGQSGGRAESATLQDYGEDVRAVVNFLRKRKDVDNRRIAVVGHSEGGLAGLIAAAKDKRKVAALVLIATPGTAGGELVLEQQRHLLDRMDLPDDERQNRIALQKRIQEAVVSGSGWEGIPSAYRRQADTPWFRSFVLFDPAGVIRNVEAPLLVVQGERDRQVTVRHAYRLIEMAKARKRPWPADLVVVDGINHLLVPAPTGEVTEYASLADKTVSPKVISQVAGWLHATLAGPTGK